MRWDELFDDLASQFDAGLEEERRRAAIDEERLRVNRLTLRDRLGALDQFLKPDERITLELHTGERVEIRPIEFGADWFGADLVGVVRRYGACIVPIAGIGSVLLTGDQIARSLEPLPERPGAVTGKLGLSIPLRDLARRRSHCEITTLNGTYYGTIDRVGRDHIDIAMHDIETPRRQSQIGTFRLVPLADLTLIRVQTD
ncbi:hypothetical protein [Gulosibacter chungangensis]|uniref:Uncharacterized protein n=1 Tax=Gulosibacter chungangensis TaxID=979746 RepID=A0A7J5B8M9_9MICO|nr:hypothetical protein [Gulosibacter chungangensis]KAB1641158.1 hypothetical protein F8O05_13065 [Gulosibacter chungangensis]